MVDEKRTSPTNTPSEPTNSSSNQFVLNPSKSTVPQLYYPAGSSQTSSNAANASASTPGPAGTSSTSSSHPYYDATAPGVWKNTWAMAYPYAAQSTGSMNNPYSQQFAFTQFQPSSYQNHYKVPTSKSQTPTILHTEAKFAKTKPPSPSPPPPDPCRDWDVLLRTFMKRLGLTQALKGFELDMLVMNQEWEESNIAACLEELVKGIQNLQNKSLKEEDDKDKIIHERPLEERKFDYVHLANGVEPRTPTSINKLISEFLSRKRSHNETSNRNEFLLSIAQKRANLSEILATDTNDIASCARTDARPVDRDSQMKYDIAKNEDGPLRRTMKKRNTGGNNLSQSSLSSTKGKGKAQSKEANTSNASSLPQSVAILPERHPGLDERLSNIETHLSVRYVPSPPLSLLDRLKFLEDHIIQLEKEYPPWAALHFNQPNRSWPPPLSTTPIIVPPHLTRDIAKKPGEEKSANLAPSGSAAPQPKGRKDSSLHRAVLERLEVKNAKNVLAGRG
ncbi:hypothetical protein E1B28_000428 [Marasmius oreades]|uniref:Uncharacterized protein n=1 Tax=Marasmius oreades TaxID=181124 RepID=A0A9P7V199_9AGAR|nr:uncharacterized protein E1B28_000428 [Marasmius oreades]KAG7098483.1 hypothetical protein E1B28_000428 [Marasmius oreades]